MVHITNVMFPHVSNALQKFGARVKGIVPKKTIDNGNNKNKNLPNPNEVEHSDIQPQTPQEKTKGAVKKFNAANEQRIIAATNSFAEIDNDCMLLQEYNAYRTVNFKNTTFTVVSEDTISGKYRGKDVEIKLKDNDDGTQTQEINQKAFRQLWDEYLGHSDLPSSSTEKYISGNQVIQRRSML